ncbi:MAG: M56 family metallopeptidase [Ruminococcus sp.]|nr:M56 family metallopeptidase [Ruminococcus sp.]
MSDLFLKIVNMSITAGWITLVIVVLRFLLKKAPKFIHCALWTLVGIRLIFPFSFESILSLVPSTQTFPENFVYSSTPKIHSGVAMLNSAVNPIIKSHSEIPGEASTSPMQTVVLILAICWVVGVIAMLIYTAVSYLKIQRQVRESIQLEDNIYLCDRIDTPFIFGIFRPKIFLPNSTCQDDYQYIIAHEKAHLRRKDHIYKPLAFAILSVYWFNPVLWVAYALLCRDIELACDERVIKEMGAEIKKPYSQALINCSVSHKVISACPLAFGEVSVKSRIKSVLNYKQPAFWVVVVAVVVCIAASVCLLTNPIDKSGDDQTFEASMQSIDMDDPDVYNEIMIGDAIEFKAKEIIFESDPESGFAEYINTYRFVKNSKFLMENDSYYGVHYIGIMKQISFAEEDFGTAFHGGVWRDGCSLAKIRKENKETLKIVDARTVFYLLEQKDGSVYFAIGQINDDGICEMELMYLAKTVDVNARDGLENNTIESPYKRYSYMDSDDWLSPSLCLMEEDKSFTFVYSALSSYVATGKYELKGNTLTLRTDDGNYAYVFRAKGNSFVFDAKHSAKIPEYRYSASSNETSCPVPDKAVFELEGECIGWPYGSIYMDKTKYDIDSDGVKEDIFVTPGPTSGIFSFVISVYKNGKLEHENMFTPQPYLSLSFVKDKKGNLQLRGETQDDKPDIYLFDIALNDDVIELSCDGEPLDDWGCLYDEE